MLNITLRTAALILVASLGLPTSSFADKVDKLESAFKKADKDNDGTLDREEAKAMPHVTKDFDAIDADKDGTVSLEEIHSFMKAGHKATN